jgi:peptidoglycan/LPS O-acetylase OafA/YrhL
MLERSALNQGNNFDALRVLAAVAVLVSHSFPIAYGAAGVQPLAALSRGQTNLGSAAVLVFFVISGFLITQSFDRLPVPLRFLEARVLRIFPGLSVVLVLTAGMLGASVTPLSLAQYLTRFDTYQYVYGGLSLVWMHYDLPGVFEGNPAGAVVNGSLWTLQYEFLMYLVVLALGMGGLLSRRVVLALWLGALLLSWRWVGGNYVAFGTPFLSGAVLYLWRDRVPLDWCSVVLCVVGLGGAMATSGFRLAFAIFGAYLVIYLALAPSVRLPNLARWGDLSYGIYIFAWPVQQTVALLLGSAVTWYWNAALSLPTVLALAWLSWHLVERPALSLKHSQAMARTIQH